MILPNADKARVDKEKIAEYLLCDSHPDGGPKARFFRAFGFGLDDWEALADALKKHGRDNQVASVVDGVFGRRYTVEGLLEAPDGRSPSVATVWILEKDSDSPRLITAYPARRQRQ